ncbi:3-carboxyethylcatechol 2,3-dioxygenase [Corynebacterium sp. A21]|uniref:3-carboxyethylcatechol 2,3-dioxygenase n=1 Tax=Corynebacterium sp. A21 TaxID=3457318 RepID=UPI003FD643A3
MSVSLLAMSHSPLLGINDPQPDVDAALNEAFDAARREVEAFDPDLVIIFTPDHFNGFFYDLLPQYCIGYAAESMGDYKTTAGPLNVPVELSEDLAQYVIDRGLDVAISREMVIDHGGAQPLEILLGGLEAKPVIPIFVNGVARPFAPMERIRQLGEAVGEWAKGREERVLLIASGGLSHDPPLPRWATATEPQKDFMLHGHPDQADRDAREARVVAAGRKASTSTGIIDINPEWDKQFMADCTASAQGATVFDSYTADQMDAAAGHSSHEVRTWVAGFAALAQANGEFTVNYEFYRPIPEFVAGFGLMSAQ